ncbi:uncharacterized protein LOC141850987 [Brevipalpus obovatus]|uniref:uncharacterized protein LOC141850987 n=1 Tax=Brevipalpus obovatus TaxID=246614 RepID=UPI003D9F12EC
MACQKYHPSNCLMLYFIGFVVIFSSHFHHILCIKRNVDPDHIFSSHLESNDLKVQNFFNKQSSIIDNGFSSLFWDYFQRTNGSQVIISDRCRHDLQKVVRGIRLKDQWAEKMISSSGRFPNDFYQETYTDFGDYDSCLGINYGKQSLGESGGKGRHCLVSLFPDFDATKRDGIPERLVKQLYPIEFDTNIGITLKIGVCIPSTCSAGDVGKIFNQALKGSYWEQDKECRCREDTTFIERLKSATIDQKFAVLVLMTLASFTIWAGLIDIRRTFTPQHWESKIQLPFFYGYFSPKENLSNLLKPSNGDRWILIDRLRIVCYVIVFAFHVINWPFALALSLTGGLFNTRTAFTQLWAQPLIGLSFVEGLFMMAGAVTTFQLWKKTSRETPLRVYILWTVEKFLMYQPIIMVVILTDIALPLFNLGPATEVFHVPISQSCRQNFLYIILHAATLLAPFELCVVHTWTFSLELHLFVFVAVVMYCYRKKPLLGMAINIALIAGGLSYAINNIYQNSLQPTFLIYPFTARETYRFTHLAYFSTRSHIWSHMVGVFSILMVLENFDKRLSPTLRKHSTKICAMGMIFVSYSTGILNCFKVNLTPLISITYFLAIQLIFSCVFIFFMLIDAKEGRRIMRVKNDQSNQVEIILNGTKNSSKIESNSLSNNNDLSSIKSTTHNSSHQSTKTIKWSDICLNILRVSFFPHSTILNWYYSQFRSPINIPSVEWVIHILIMHLLIFTVGPIFHCMITGPWTMFYNGIKQSKASKKSAKIAQD